MLGRLKRNIRLASKTVRHGFRQYICFYIAFFMIQLLFGLVTMSAASAATVRTEQLESLCDYHVCLVGVNEAQYKALKKDTSVIRTEERTVDGKTRVYDMYCYFSGDCREEFESFYSEKIEKVQGKNYGNIGVDITYSPLYELQNELDKSTAVCFAALGALLAVGTAVILLLYRVRVDHFKFTYGIYTSFGADFRKLFEASLWEMLVISLFTLLPSAVVATVADSLLFRLNGLEYRYAPQYMLLAIPFSAVIAYISVLIPIKLVSRTPPVKLLLAEDNSGLVASPRRSFNMTARSFSGSYSIFSAIRFRRYNIRLIICSVSFALLFVLTAFFGDVYSFLLSREEAEYTVDFSQTKVETVETVTTHESYTEEAVQIIHGYGKDPEKWSEQYAELLDPSKYIIEGDIDNYRDPSSGFSVKKIVTEKHTVIQKVGDTLTPELSEELQSISGVTGIYKSCSARAYQIASHMKVLPSKVRAGSGMLSFDGMYYTNRVCYYATDEDIVEFLTSRFEYSGDPSLLLDNDDVDKHYVIVTNTKNNTVSMKLEVGDYVTLAQLIEMPEYEDILSGNKLLRYHLENGTFDYTRFEVCAVIDGMSSGSNYPLFISEADYHMLTGKYPAYKKIDVYVDQSLKSHQLLSLTDELRSWSEKYSYTSLTLNEAIDSKDAELAQCRTPLFIFASLAMLSVLPLVYCFSQVMFYGKRRREFELLRGMGAIRSEIRGIFLRDGALYALFGGVMSALLGAVLLCVADRLTAVMTSGGAFGARYVMSGTWRYLAFGALVTAFVGALASVIPYISYLREQKRSSTMEEHYTSDDE